LPTFVNFEFDHNFDRNLRGIKVDSNPTRNKGIPSLKQPFIHYIFVSVGQYLKSTVILSNI